MHIILEDQAHTADKSVLCINRDTHTAIVLQGDVDRLDELINIAAAQHVPEVQMIVDPKAVEILTEAGWKMTNKVVMKKKAGK